MSLLPSRIAAVAALALFAGSAGAQIPVATEFDALHFRSIGPATMSGRIADLAIYEKNPAVWYVATAHGGLWKTTSGGAMFTPLLQHQGLMSLGDVAISQTNPDLVWVGSGESNNRQSTGWGDGIYKSTDGGQTFTHMGLKDSKHINRILIDPANNDIVYVAATGPLWGPGGERGVYKTTDGGRSWRLVLKGDENTGANDLAMSAKDPKVLYASMYQRRRTNCCMNGGGPGSGLFRSVDGGETWTKVAGGFPDGPLGRIAVDVYRQDPNIVYASVEAPAVTPVDSGKTGVWRSDDAGATWRKLNSNNPRPMYFSQVRIDPNNADRVYMGGVGMQMTVDGGKTWETDAALVTHDDVHAIWVDPGNSDHLVIGNDGGLAVSWDMSRTWTFIPNLPVGLFYHVGYDMERPFNICGGMQDNYDWCGPSASRHGAGIYNYDWFQILGGDGFVAIPDPRDSRWVYTESQDGNTIRRNVVTGESRSIRPNASNVTPAPAQGEAYRFHWDTPMIHGTEPGVLYIGGNKVFRSTDRGDSWAVISPDLTRNGNRNDSTMFGVKNSDITIARNDGIASWPAIVALAESPKQAGVVWAGTDDGAVQMTRDGGKSWTDVTGRLAGFPAGAFVSEVVPSRFDAGTAYVSVDDHRQNNYGAYVWVTTDFGATFRRIDGGLAGEVVHTLTEDTRNADVLYAGTESGIFLSLDRGASWRRLRANFPNVRVDELTIHPRDNALLVASHGRAIWVLDHLEPIQEYAAAQRAEKVALFSVPTALQWKAKDDRNDEFWGHQTFIGENPPVDAVISFLVKTPPQSLALRISSGTRVIREIAVPAAKNRAGIQTVCWDQRVAPITGAPAGGPGGGFGGGGGGGGGGGQFGQGGNRTRAVAGVPTPLPTAGYQPQNPCAAGGPGQGGGGGGFGGFGGGGANAGPYATPGTYQVSLVADGAVVDTKPITIVMDPKVEERFRGAQRVAYDKLVNDLHAAQQRGQDVATRLTALATQVAIVDARLDTAANVSAAAKAAYATFKTTFNDVRTKFGVQPGRVPGTAPAGAPGQGGPGGPGGGGGGGFGGAQFAQPGNALGRVGQLKGLLIGIWEEPSASSRQNAADAMKALDEAIKAAQALLGQVPRLNEAFKPSALTITLP
ncbi:MAG: hypothetical protein K1X31_02310 [Gemmatimonadaceae bacterium]|nr:hypothetical protein [Gemmatimonadaceae bacterium]